MSPVVVTGLGAVQPDGCGAGGVRLALERGSPRTTAVDESDDYHRTGGARRAATADHVDLSAWLSARQARRMSQPSKYAVAAGAMALEGAGFDREGLGDGALAVALATAFGTARYAEELVKAILTQGPEAASPFHFSESVANAPAAQVAIANRGLGANVAITQRESGPLQAVALAAREVGSGRSQRALAGSSDEINPLVHAVLDRFRALARAGRHGEEGELGRPFGRRRNGFVAAEGASVLLLEGESAAAARGAPVLATVVATARAFDPTAPAHGWGDGAVALAAQLGDALSRQGVAPGDLDVVVSGASGAVAGDRLEAATLRAYLGEDLPAVVAPKGATGEFGGGHLAAAVLAAGGELYPTPACGEPDPELGVVPWSGEAIGKRPLRVLVTSLAAGGAACWLVLEGPP